MIAASALKAPDGNFHFRHGWQYRPGIYYPQVVYLH